MVILRLSLPPIEDPRLGGSVIKRSHMFRAELTTHLETVESRVKNGKGN